MRNLLGPDERYGKITDINLGELWEKGIRGLILDLDNTIVPWGEDTPKEEVIEFVERAKEKGYKLALISNAQPHRVEKCGKILGISGIGYAKKPLPFSLKKAQKNLLRLPPSQVAIIGDQIFTDILGGNLLGFYTVLVEPITKRDFIGTKLFRLLEQVLRLR